MRISCVIAASELDAVPADLIVFPEGVCRREIEKAQSFYPEAVIVAAIVENGFSRGVLLHGGRNRIDYLKVESDGRTVGSGDHQQVPIYEFEDVCIGVLICMDVDCLLFSRAVIEKVRTSSAKLKLLCVPADMTSDWFSGDALSSVFEAIHVVLCNHTKTHQARCKSFVTDMHGRKIVVQDQDEPIHAELP
jgi:hypothetical protein